jgi:hypothetical protein
LQLFLHFQWQTLAWGRLRVMPVYTRSSPWERVCFWYHWDLNPPHSEWLLCNYCCFDSLVMIQRTILNPDWGIQYIVLVQCCLHHYCSHRHSTSLSVVLFLCHILYTVAAYIMKNMSLLCWRLHVPKTWYDKCGHLTMIDERTRRIF